jgi:hypothetical protein
MRKIRQTVLIALIIAVAAGCASKNMNLVDRDAYVSGPAPGKALIYFIRNTTFGGGVHASLYDGEDYIGTITANTHIAYQANPGSHLFMVMSESADFMKADLTAGKTYYAYVMPRMGAWVARFSFRPINGQVDQADIDASIRATKQIAPNEQGMKWGEKSKARAAALKEKYLPEWESKPDDAKQILRAESGK